MAPKQRLQVEFDFAAAARLVLDSYLEFLNSPVPAEEKGDSKAFANRQTGGRAALSHLEQLDKIAGLLGSEAQQEAVGAILAEARRNLAALSHDEKEDPDGDAGGDA